MPRLRPPQPPTISSSALNSLAEVPEQVGADAGASTGGGGQELGGDALLALAQGDVCKALLFLEQETEAADVADAAAGAESATGTIAVSPNEQQSEDHHDQQTRDGRSEPPNTNLGALHGRLVELLWQGGHERQALEALDLARGRARVAAEADAYGKGRRVQRKAGAGVPGLRLGISAATCHGIMRAKLAAKDSEAVIEAMRASSCVPRRVGRSAAGGWTAAAAMQATATAKTVAAAAGEGQVVVDRLTRTDKGLEGAHAAGGESWAPTEETYALALEACGRVRSCMYVCVFLMELVVLLTINVCGYLTSSGFHGSA